MMVVLAILILISGHGHSGQPEKQPHWVHFQISGQMARLSARPPAGLVALGASEEGTGILIDFDELSTDYWRKGSIHGPRF